VFKLQANDARLPGTASTQVVVDGSTGAVEAAAVPSAIHAMNFGVDVPEERRWEGAGEGEGGRGHGDGGEKKYSLERMLELRPRVSVPPEACVRRTEDTYVYMDVCMCVCMCERVGVHMCACMYICMYVCRV